MEKKKILIVTNHFFPEQFKVNDLSDYLSDVGYNVKVITQIPNYPIGKFYKGYGFFKKSREIKNNIKIRRLPVLPRYNGSKFFIFFNYFSYFISLSIYFIYLIFFKKKYDIILIHHTSPIFLFLPTILYKKINRSKIIFWNLDLWPDAVKEYIQKLFLKKYIIIFLEKIVKLTYQYTDVLLVSSKSFIKHALSRNFNFKNIYFFPNWAEDVFLKNKSSIKPLRFNKINSEKFKVMFAGNIGAAQDMNNIINAINLTKEENLNISWLIVGDGRKLSWMKKEIHNKNLKKFVHFLGRYNIKMMPYLYDQADVMLISLLDTSGNNNTVPAKLQSYMAYGKPILGMLTGEGNSLISQSKCGLAVNSGDFKGLFKNIKIMKNLKDRSLRTYGMNGKLYYKKYFSKHKTFKNLKEIIDKI